MTGKAVNSPKTGAGRHELPKKSGSRLPAALYPFRPELRPPHLWVQSTTGRKTESAYFYSRAFRFATHYPVRFLLYPRFSSFVPLGVGLSCPVPRLREGFPKAGAEAPGLCVVGGPERSRNALVLFFRGVGRVLFQKRMRPTSLRWEPSLAGAENYVKARGIAARFLVIRNHDGCPSKFQALRKGK